MGHIVNHNGIAVIFYIGGLCIVHIGCVGIDSHPFGLVAVHIGTEPDYQIALIDEQKDHIFCPRVIEYLYRCIFWRVAFIYLHIQLVDRAILPSY